MNVSVLIAGIADPKWPVDSGQPRILSPFDESALEVALKLRDRDPANSICAVLIGDATDEPLARTVASHRPDRLVRRDVPAACAWDLGGLAGLLKVVVQARENKPELVLIGREFGDRDDGAVPVCLASLLGWQFVGLAQEIVLKEGVLVAVRERAGFEERIEHRPPLVASITNDRYNRLRYPLFKNVMAAKRAPLQSIEPLAATQATRVALECLAPAAAPARAVRCRMLEGSLEQRVGELAEYLRSWQQPA